MQQQIWKGKGLKGEGFARNLHTAVWKWKNESESDLDSLSLSLSSSWSWLENVLAKKQLEHDSVYV